MIGWIKKSIVRDEGFVEKLRLLGSARIFIAISLLGATLILHPGDQNDNVFNAFLFVTICHLIISVFFIAIEKIISQKNIHRLAMMQIVWDIMFHTSMVYLTGGITSQYKFLYWISIFFSSILFLRTGALIAASLSSLSYALLIDLEYFESLPKLFESFTHFSFSTEKVIMSSIILNSLTFFFIAFVVSAITTRLSRAEASVIEQEKKVRDLEEKVAFTKHLASIGEMAARIAHEIRNPLTSVSASMEMLAKKENEGSNEGMILDIARKEARRLNQLLTDFLDYARPSQPSYQKEKLSNLLNESIQLFRQGYPNVEITFQNNIKDESKLKLDTRMVLQVLWNVLKNAAEAMNDAGKIQILLSEHGYKRYLIEVRDEGSGLVSQDHNKIFEPFYSSKPRGTGLGLSIAYRVMQDHNGSIDLESLNPKGCNCKLIFPTEFKEKTYA